MALNCTGILSVLILDDKECAGVSTESENAVNGNSIPRDQQAVQWQSCGKINVMN
jgi:hypothetical protein